MYADCQRNARESEIREGDTILLRQEKRHTNSLPLQNVTHVKKYLERDYNVLPATSKSTDASEAQRATQSLSNQESRETVNVSSERGSEDCPLEYTRSDDATMEQRGSVTLRPTRVKRFNI